MIEQFCFPGLLGISSDFNMVSEINHVKDLCFMIQIKTGTMVVIIAMIMISNTIGA